MTTMGILRILPILCLAIGAEPKGNGNSRILNGQDSSVLPYQVWLGNCGGTLIKPDWVLTADHCLSGIPITVRAGISNLRDEGERRVVPVKSMYKHKSADLALLKIDPPFQESDKIKPIKINDVHEDLYGKEVLISGWGKTTTGFSYQLQALNITINFERYYGMISMLNSNAQGACLGDSGGPAVLEGNDDVLVGVASFVAAADADQNLMEKCKTEGQRDCWTRETVCGKDANNGKQWPYQLSGYVDVFEYADWIKGKINGVPKCKDTKRAKKCKKLEKKGKCKNKKVWKKCMKTCKKC